ncbi:complement factor B-like [Ruditapes philippinarum]|uniref:complement factor B-like n=1 Tax=Ruditapes philippinarum TaxID=129788 RepID=UPI00295B81AC|nr:complement factor B-like [Ruditapes philippinarum]
MTYVCKAPIFHHHIDNITCLSDGKWSIAQCEFVDCGTPTVGSHVQLGPYNGYSRYGAQVEFRCTPCTYFSLSSTSHIRCQADGSWTIPDCVYGPDVGLLKNGLVIPTGAVGCNSSLGSTCVEENEVPGTVLRYNGQIADTCYCDSVCCSESDCCYDYKC